MALHYFLISFWILVLDLIIFKIHKALVAGKLPIQLIHELDSVFTIVFIAIATLITLVQVLRSQKKMAVSNFELLIFCLIISSSIFISERRFKPVSQEVQHSNN
jgi:hypothetical protein